MLSKIKNFFKLNNVKKWIIVILTLLSSISLTTVGSIFWINKTKFSSDYKNGAQVVLKYENKSSGQVIDEKASIEEYSKNLIKRLEYIYPDSNYEYFLDKNNSVQIKITNIDTDDQLQKIKNSIKEEKPSFFYFDTALDTKLNANQNYLDLIAKKNRDNHLLNDYLNSATLAKNSVNATLLTKPVGIESAKEYMILTNLDELEKAIKENMADYVKVEKNLYKFLFLNPKALNSDSSDKNAAKPILKTTDNGGGFDAAKFLVSTNKGSDFISTSISSPKAITFTNSYYNYKDDYRQNTLLNLVYAGSSYNNKIEALSFIQASNANDAYLYLLIAAGIVLGLISIFLLVNYGLLGSLVLIPLALLVFLSLLMIVVFHGDYDPLNILAIMLATFFALAINIPFLERIKKEVKDGLNVDKAIFKSNNLSIKSSLITSLILVIVSLLLFFVSGSSLEDFSAIILMQFIFSFFLAFLLPRVLIRLVSRSSIFEKNKKYLGIWLRKKDLNLIAKTREIESRNSVVNAFDISKSKINFVKSSKYVLLAFVTIISATLITFLSLFFVNKSALGPFNQSQLNINKTQIVIDDINDKGLNKKEIDSIKKELLNSNLKDYSFQVLNESLKNGKYQFSISVKNLSESEYAKFRNTISNKFSVDVYRYGLINSETHQKMINTIYMALVFIVAMLIFIILKYKYSSTIALGFSSFLAFAIFYASLILFQIPLSPILGALLIFSLFINLFNNMLVVNRIREKLKNLNLLELDKNGVNRVINDAVKDSFVNLILINLILLGTIIIFTTFIGALMWYNALILLIAIISSLISSLFIVPKVFGIFENLWIKRKRKTILSDYWDTEKVKEQIFPGINDL